MADELEVEATPIENVEDAKNLPDENDEQEQEDGGETEDENIEIEENYPDKILDEAMITESISLLCKTGDGLSHAYVKLDCKEKNITNIEILSRYIHLRYVDLSKNYLKDIAPLGNLQHLLTLRCDFNKLQSAAMETSLPYLQSANFNNNKIQSMDGINHPLLEQLSMNFNRIESLEGSLNPSILTRLHTLELRGNKLSSTAGLYLPNLKNLFLAANRLTSLTGLERLEQLTTLHVRDNKIETLDGFSDTMRNLQYVNVKMNNLVDIREVDKLRCLPMLRAIVLAENPIAGEDDYRLEVLISLRKIVRLDKDEYSEEEREEAEQIFEQRRQEELANQETHEVIQSDADDGGD